MTDNKSLATTAAGQMSLTEGLASQMGVSSANLIRLMKSQIIGVPKGGPEPTNEEMALVMLVMREHNLSPMVREVHAWRDNKGKLCVMIGYDGWVKFAHRNPDFSHVSYRYSDNMVEPPGGTLCPEWIAPTLHKKDGTTVEFPPIMLREWYVEPYKGKFGDVIGPWNKHTSHRLRQKAFTIIVREVYGMSVMDEIDAENLQIMDEEERDRPRAATEGKLHADADALKAHAEGLAKGEPEVDATVQQEAEEAEFEDVEEPQEADSGTEPLDYEPQDCSVHACHRNATFVCGGCQAPFCDTHKSPKGDFCIMCGMSEGGKG